MDAPDEAVKQENHRKFDGSREHNSDFGYRIPVVWDADADRPAFRPDGRSQLDVKFAWTKHPMFEEGRFTQDVFEALSGTDNLPVFKKIWDLFKKRMDNKSIKVQRLPTQELNAAGENKARPCFILRGSHNGRGWSMWAPAPWALDEEFSNYLRLKEIQERVQDLVVSVLKPFVVKYQPMRDRNGDPIPSIRLSLYEGCWSLFINTMDWVAYDLELLKKKLVAEGGDLHGAELTIKGYARGAMWGSTDPKDASRFKSAEDLGLEFED